MVIPDRLRFAANLSILFPNLAPTERPAAAAAAGFAAVESWWPFHGPTPPVGDLEAFITSLEAAGVTLVALNFYAGDMANGDRGLLSLPARVAEFRASVPTLVTIAERTGCGLFNALYGQRTAGATPDEQDDVALQNLALCAHAVAPLGGRVLIEALARGENGAYPITTAAEAVSVVKRSREVSGAANIELLLDVYHLASNGEDVEAELIRYSGYVGHVQVADVPGRHEPGTGRFNFGRFFEVLDRVDYGGWVGLEYRPLTSATASLSWLPSERRSQTVGVRAVER